MSSKSKHLSVAELLLKRKELCCSVKKEVKTIYETILSDPYKNINEIEKILSIYKTCELPSLRIYIIGKVTSIFIDLVPGYKITNDSKENNDKFSKDIKNTVIFENKFLQYYNKFIGVVYGLQNELTSLEKLKQEKIKNPILTCFVETIAKLFKHMLHFNESDRILEIFLTSIFKITDAQSQDILCTQLKDFFEKDSNCLLSPKIIEFIVKYSRSNKINSKLIETLIALDFENMSENKIKQSNKKKQVEKSKKKKQKKKENIQLQKDLIEGEEGSRNLGKIKSKMFSNLFIICFRILKDKDTPNDLLSSTLGVIAKHSQYVNMEIYIEMIRCIISYLKNDNLMIKDKLNIIIMILKFPNLGESNFIIDYNFLYEIVYRTIFDIIKESDFANIFSLFVEVMQKLVINRWKEVGFKRCSSFVKRMNSLLMFVDSCTASKLTNMIQEISKKYPQISKLLDSQSNVGVMYMNEVDHPDHCCPDGIILWERHALFNHFNSSLH